MAAATPGSTPPSALRRRVGIGLALVLVLGLGLEYWAFHRASEAASASEAQRRALVAARSIADVVSATGTRALVEAAPVEGAPGEPGDAEAEEAEPAAPEPAEPDPADEVRTAIERFSGMPGIEGIRVIDIATTSLVASTEAEDRAPRRLGREEKSLYDRAQLLRSNLETNVQEGIARKELALVESDAGGALEVAVPVLEEGEVTGMVLVDTADLLDPDPPAWWPPLLVLLGSLLLFFGAALALGGRKAVINALAVVVAVAALVGYGLVGMTDLEEARRAEAGAVAEQMVTSRAAAEEIAPVVRVETTALDPDAWDADLYGRTRGVIDAEGNIDEAALAADIGRSRGNLLGLVGGLVVASLLVLLFVGLGFAGRVGTILRKNRQAYLYVVPAMLGMLVLVFFPFAYGIALSFTESNLYNTDRSIPEIWVGVDNYVEILTDWKVFQNTDDGVVWDYQNFYWTLGFTILWTVSNVAFGVTVGLLLALMLNVKGLALKPMYRVLLILPWAVPNYITALIWRGMFHRQFGVVNQIVQIFGGDAVSWFESPFTSFMAVLATNGWLSFPFMMVVSLGALQSIPGDLYEAARVDGATRWQQFRSITLPSLKPALVPAIILSVIWTFNMFNIIYLTSQGEPAHATEILITEAYKIAFEQYRYGYAAAYSTVIFLILLAYGVWQNRVTRATESIG